MSMSNTEKNVKALDAQLRSRLWHRSASLLPHGKLRGGTSDAVAFEAQHKHHLLAASNNQQKTSTWRAWMARDIQALRSFLMPKTMPQI